jgi:hypothetical protein
MTETQILFATVLREVYSRWSALYPNMYTDYEGIILKQGDAIAAHVQQKWSRKYTFPLVVTQKTTLAVSNRHVEDINNRVSLNLSAKEIAERIVNHLRHAHPLSHDQNHFFVAQILPGKTDSKYCYADIVWTIQELTLCDITVE